MKKFLILIFSVLALVIAVVVLLEYRYRDYKTAADQLFEKFYRKQKTAETLYIGNSHIGAFNFVIKDTTTRLANMSIGGQDIFRMYTVIKELLPRSHSIKKVVLNIDYDLIGYNQTLSGQEYVDRQYYPYVHELYNNTYANYLMSRSSFFRSNRDLSYLIHPSPKTASADNFIPLNNNGGKPDDSGCKNRAMEHTLYKFHKSYMRENISYLCDIDSICKLYNVRLIIITTPKTSCYKSHSDVSNISLAKNKLDSIVKAKKMLYKDYYTDESFVDTDFVDYDHLNERGVKNIMVKIDSL